MKNLLVVLFSLTLTLNSLSQNFNGSYIEPDNEENFVSLYFSIDSLKLSKSKISTNKFDSLNLSKSKVVKSGFNYFAFRITANTIYYNTKNKSLIGNFVSITPNLDTLHIVMSEKNGNYLFFDIIKTKTDKIIVVIREKSLSGKTKVYFSDDCKLERSSI